MALFGYHFHTFGSGMTELGMLQRLAATGGGAARFDSNWSDYQSTPVANSFNANSVSLTGTAYENYLISRGYQTAIGNTPSLFWVYDRLLKADQNNINIIFNFGVNPLWAQDSSLAAANPFKSSSLSNPAVVGQFLADFIVYISKQPSGIEVLKNMGGWQIFNEVNNIYGTGSQTVNGVTYNMLPYNQYFAVVDNALALTKQAYTSINWNAVSGGVEAPDVVAPALGGVYDPAFLNALLSYVPVNATATNAQGKLALDAISLHPYGARIDAWNDPFTGQGVDTTNVASNLTFHRIILPTDDRWTWEAMVARDQGDNTINYNLFTYASQGNNADEYFDRNAEVGVERTMAKLAQAGYTGLEANFTEWGASTYRGTLADGSQSLWNTTFADPFKYGYTPSGQILSQDVAENLQAETVAQTIGLIESWDFTTDATVYEIFDQTTGSSYQGQYGLAYYQLDGSGNPVYKPAGLAFNAYMAGIEYHRQETQANNLGVDVHIAAAGVAGAFNNALRDTTAHEIILMRQGDDTVSGGNGDDIIFGGDGNDIVNGDAGWDKLYGGFGNDNLNGGANSDKLKGDSGDDTLTGGTSGDQFVFAAFAATGSGNAGNDTITDFNIAEDKLTIIGGYSAAVMLNNTSNPNLIQDVSGGVRIYYADNGASILLQGLSESQLTANIFRSLETDSTIGYAPPAGNTINGTVGADTINGTAGADIINGLAGNDNLYGLGSNDTLNGGDNDDWLLGGAGADVLNGGNGWDTVDYAASAAAVTVDLSTNTATGGDAQGDTFIDVEVLGGSTLNDTLTGTNGFNSIWGNSGNDSIFGLGSDDSIDGMDGDDWLIGGAGADTINGGNGWDLVDYFNSAAAVTVNLSTGTGIGGDAQGDVISNVETLGGSAFNDTLTGTAGFNNIWGGNGVDNIDGAGSDDMLDGGAGNDTILGNTGSDRLIGATGADTLTGGALSDTFQFAAGDTGQTAGTLDTITDYTKGAVGTGDKLDYAAIMTIGGSAAAATATQAAINTSTGIATFAAGSGTTLADALADIATRFTAATNSVGEMAFFKVNNAGNYLMFISDGTAGVTANDVVIQTNIAAIGSLNFTSGDITILT